MIKLLAILSIVCAFTWYTDSSQLHAQQSKLKSVKVMSFNIRYGSARDGDNHWDKRKELVAKTIKSYSPDLLGLQETLPFQARFLQKTLHDYTYVGWTRDNNPDGEQCGIMFRTDRFEKLESGQFWLSETPKQKASKSWDSSLPRVATWILLKDNQNDGREFLFVNTHFDHRGNQARHESAKLIKSWLAANHNDKPIVVTGDFNTGANTTPYSHLVNAEKPPLYDTFGAINENAENSGTFNGFRGVKTGARIDWVLVSEHWKTTAAEIDHTKDEGRYPSDHFPVTATINWKK